MSEDISDSAHVLGVLSVYKSTNNFIAIYVKIHIKMTSFYDFICVLINISTKFIFNKTYF